ncbi:MAG: SUMF1/EgtB/PvdO family nonheme iron enzyme [Thiothrix sp.]|uniref:SUMF1/EgtB/PvdO family nonheme iron enzyme n=1 Tax=Thiothrix sp. TaxID=1032 RepID=UPI002634AE21|nr:SUMF1/EgtB/PvdO family nonheme iron enzyme [Thiothrix sp.]MDD5392233.1 SUMF1/EgtB/PvdO family nonheme iron enzyme [Thiothrix sp.]
MKLSITAFFLLAALLVGCGEKQPAQQEQRGELKVLPSSTPSPVPAAVDAEADGKRVALVIGNQAYADSPLRNPVNDADKMAEALRGLGFEVMKATNLDQKGIKAAIRRFGERLDSNSVGLFYFSGHGTQVGGKNYLIPIGAEIQYEDEVADAAVDADLVLAKMESARNGLNILILDACRNNPFSRSFRSSTKGLARMDAPTGTVIIYATSPGDVAADGTGDNGLFTSHLLQHIKTPGIDIGETLRLTRLGVLQQSEREGKKQVPWESSSLLARFCFAGCGQPAQASPVSLPTAAKPVAAAPPARLPFEPEMVAIPSGKFTMGCKAGRDDVDGDCNSGEKPAHEVSISAFQLAKTEVMFDQWDACEKADACPHADDEGWGRGDLPVINVSWDDVTLQYIPWLNQETGKNYRLPTEAEWEYAARAGTASAYPWGNGIGKDNANCYEDSCGETFDSPSPVGSFAANSFGLYDMHGNVWEWVQDWKGAYAAEPQADPTGASSGANRVLRGGSWYNAAGFLRSAYRHISTPDNSTFNVGLRLAHD